MLKTEKFKYFLRWIPAIAIMVLIFIFSAQSGEISTRQSDAIAKEITKSSDSDRKPTKKETRLVRKSAHFLSYMSLGISVFWAMKDRKTNIKRVAMYSALISFAYAITDELHQMLVPGRSAEIRDVCLDFGGVMCGILIMIFVCHIKKEKSRANAV